MLLLNIKKYFNIFLNKKILNNKLLATFFYLI